MIYIITSPVKNQRNRIPETACLNHTILSSDSYQTFELNVELFYQTLKLPISGCFLFFANLIIVYFVQRDEPVRSSK